MAVLLIESQKERAAFPKPALSVETSVENKVISVDGMLSGFLLGFDFAAGLERLMSNKSLYRMLFLDFVERFANIVIENKRTEDLFARYGGEEFIIMPRAELRKEDLYILCERIRKAVENFEFCFDEACVRITISLGFHLMKVEGSDFEKILNDLIGKADQALFLAKERGRNRTKSLLE